MFCSGPSCSPLVSSNGTVVERGLSGVMRCPFHFRNPRGLRSQLSGRGTETRRFSLRLTLGSPGWSVSFLRCRVGDCAGSGRHVRRPKERSLSWVSSLEQGGLSWDPTASRPPSSLIGPGRVTRLPQSSSWEDGLALRLQPALFALGSLSKGGWLSGVGLLREQAGLWGTSLSLLWTQCLKDSLVARGKDFLFWGLMSL